MSVLAPQSFSLSPLSTKTIKHAARRSVIIDASIRTLTRRGYANTSLRAVAAEASVSLGIVHYYFDDKVDLIHCCIREIKQQFVSTIKAIILNAPSSERLCEQLAVYLAQSIDNNWQRHHLWYDISAQANYELRFQEVIQNIEKQFIEAVNLLVLKTQSRLAPDLLFAMLDGVFRLSIDSVARGRTTRASIQAKFELILTQHCI